MSITAVKKDQMTAKERSQAFAEGKPVDRIPCNLFIGDHSAGLIGAKVADLHLSVEKAVEAQVVAHRIYETEGTSVGPGLGGVAEAMGSKLEFPDFGAPYVSDYAVKEFSDLDRLSVPDPAKAGRFPIILKTAGRLIEELGKELPVSMGVPGPFTTAGNIRGAERFMRDLYRNPEFAHRLLRLSTDSIIAFVREAAKLDVSISIAEPTASGSLISREQFRIFAFPYLKELIDSITAAGKKAPSMHICGNTKKIWHEMAETGAGMLSLDNQVDLADAKHAVGDRVVIVGNIKPTETMYLGNPADVEANAKECLRKAYDNPKGYILALGCGLPIRTPPGNIHALRDSARKFGQYPLDPANFS
jgi:uroporphyrinogen decarboxylase